MKIEEKKLSACELQLVIEVDPETVEQAKRDAASKLSRGVNIPGFRKGKAPYRVALSHLGEHSIMEKVLDDLSQTLYREAVESTNVQPIAPGEMVDASLDPMKLTFNIALAPEVDVGDYSTTRVEYQPADTVSDEKVSETIEMLREQHALLEPIDRPAQEGDVVRLDVLGMLEDDSDETDELLDEKDTELVVGEKNEWPMPGFSEKLLGIISDEQRTFEMSFPEDYVNTSLANKLVNFRVKCRGIKSRTLPELDDDFAVMLDGEHETLLELRISIREQLQQAANAKHQSGVEQQAVDAVVDRATVSFPPMMLNSQIDDMLREQDRALRGKGLTLEDHLKIEGVSEEKLREDITPEATKRVKRALVLGKVIETEGLQVNDDAVEERITASAEAFGEAADQVRSALDNEQSRRSIRNGLLTELAVEKLVEITKGEMHESSGDKLERIAESDDSTSEEDNSIAPKVVQDPES